MEEIISAFGIDWRLIGIQILNFGLLAFVLWYLLYEPMLKIIDKRRTDIAEGVKNAELAGAKLREADEERSKIVNTAHGEAQEIVSRASEQGKSEQSRIIADAKARSEAIVLEAQKRAEEDAKRIVNESREEVTRLAILAAEKILKGEK